MKDLNDLWMLRIDSSKSISTLSAHEAQLNAVGLLPVLLCAPFQISQVTRSHPGQLIAQEQPQPAPSNPNRAPSQVSVRSGVEYGHLQHAVAVA
ncbi:hypothetical protein BD310DRAFT_718537 [Dichomitus squalens]|uniref:Uncharacterized protein n=1 Tax=Dichomitus squalens TaxID=114155 RepID=A0A4Q9PLD4_9APHY|nr:hypothetical protein BD310DRAFT_718537 [Dichomitus squalens]